MTHWPFILAAYAVSAAGTLLLVLTSWTGMRRAEAEAEATRRER